MKRSKLPVRNFKVAFEYSYPGGIDAYVLYFEERLQADEYYRMVSNFMTKTNTPGTLTLSDIRS